jgi:hypothetical protein
MFWVDGHLIKVKILLGLSFKDVWLGLIVIIQAPNLKSFSQREKVRTRREKSAGVWIITFD